MFTDEKSDSIENLNEKIQWIVDKAERRARECEAKRKIVSINEFKLITNQYSLLQSLSRNIINRSLIFFFFSFLSRLFRILNLFSIRQNVINGKEMMEEERERKKWTISNVNCLSFQLLSLKYFDTYNFKMRQGLATLKKNDKRFGFSTLFYFCEESIAQLLIHYRRLRRI